MGPGELQPLVGPSGPRRAALTRLAILTLVVAGLFGLATLTGRRPTADSIRGWADGYGAWGPLAYVGLSAALSCAFVPGPLLAGTAGALFGTLVGTPVAVASSSLAAVSQLLIGRHVAGRPVRQYLLPRVGRLDAFLEERGLMAVVVVRLLPGVPSVPVNYSSGLTRLRARDMAAGTALGALAKTFAYVALGGSLEDLGRPEARVAVAVLLALAVLGLWLARRELALERGRRPL